MSTIIFDWSVDSRNEIFKVIVDEKEHKFDFMPVKIEQQLVGNVMKFVVAQEHFNYQFEAKMRASPLSTPLKFSFFFGEHLQLEFDGTMHDFDFDTKKKITQEIDQYAVGIEVAHRHLGGQRIVKKSNVDPEVWHMK